MDGRSGEMRMLWDPDERYRVWGLARRKLLERGKKDAAPVLVRVASIFTSQEWEALVPIRPRRPDAVPPPWWPWSRGSRP